MSTAVLDRPRVRPAVAPARRRRRPSHAVFVARRLVTMALLLVVVSGIVWTLSAQRSDATADASTVAATVVVGPGDTVWDIATAYAPAGENTHAYVARVLRFNGIDAAAVAPGTVLQLPRG